MKPFKPSLPKATLQLCVVFTFVFFSPANGQNINSDYCASDAEVQRLFNDHPSLKAKQDSLEQEIYRQLDGVPLNGGGSRQIYTIPVVVHIIHNNGTENISDARVTDAMQHLNDAFRNTGFY